MNFKSFLSLSAKNNDPDMNLYCPIMINLCYIKKNLHQFIYFQKAFPRNIVPSLLFGRARILQDQASHSSTFYLHSPRAMRVTVLCGVVVAVVAAAAALGAAAPKPLATENIDGHSKSRRNHVYLSVMKRSVVKVIRNDHCKLER